ncbi:hypothetical protein ANANG_G00247120, partial [Anguilla anguilla]
SKRNKQRNLPAADNLGPGSISHSILQRWRLLLSKCEIIIHKAGFRQSFMLRSSTDQTWQVRERETTLAWIRMSERQWI